MSPAFSSLRQAVGFILLLLFLLLLPLLVPRSALPPRETVYNTQPWNVGPYPFIHDQIYVEKGDIDIAIVGDSQIWAAIDTPMLQQELSKALGRPAVVVTLCCPWTGFDGIYFLTRDLLAHRKVHMLIFADASGLNPKPQETPHKEAWRWFRYTEDADEIASLPLRVKLAYYYGSIIGLPRNLFSLLRPNLGPLLTDQRRRELDDEQHWVMPNTRLGALAMHESYNNRPDLFAPFTPVTNTQPSDFVIYSPGTAGDFRFADLSSEASVQTYFAQKFASLATNNGTRLVCLNVPYYQYHGSQSIHERYNWAEMMHAPVTLIGIPPATLFNQLSSDDLPKLFWDDYHFNENGQQYFTRLLAPNLISIYDASTKN
jgi:hypothetical protein